MSSLSQSFLSQLKEKVSQFPTGPGVYLWRDGQDRVIYVGKAKNLRARVRSYFNDDRLAEAKNGTMVETARDISYILVDNEKEALGLENNLIKQHRPRFNVLLRDDKTYPYIKLTNEKFPRVYVTRRLRKDGQYFGPYFPGNLAHRLNHFIHRHFKIPSCKVDFNRKHTHPCLEYHINRCHGPCVEGLVSIETYQHSVNDVRRFLDGRLKDLTKDLGARMAEAAENLEFERAASLRNLIATVEEMEQRQKVASAEGEDIDIFAYHAEAPLVAVNLFHLRRGRIVDRRELFWEDQESFQPEEFFQQLLIQVYLNQPHIPAIIHVPLDFEDRAVLEELLTEKRGKKCTISTPQRGEKKAMLALVETNAKHSFEQRFRVLRPSSEAIKEALRDALSLEEAPRRIECFDISHIQGTDKVASMVVWEDGRMKKSDYRKFIIKKVEGNNDFASMAEVVSRRYSRLKEEGAVFPGLVLIDGGLGQLHAAADALEAIGVINQPLASLAKREELIYVLGQEDEPIYLERHNPVLHLVQMIRDEAHRFAVSFHRTRRNASRLTSELEEIPGIGKATLGKLLRAFGSPEQVKAAGFAALAQVIGPAAARKVEAFYAEPPASVSPISSDGIS
ncbi:MAG: excinuclease ABC subunit UvrC [Bryobacter sp.]